MTFGEAIKTVLGKYADFDGTAGRPEFWWWMVFNTLGAGACNLFTIVNDDFGQLLTGLWELGLLLPTLAVGVRRLRDAGRDWRTIFWLLVPIAGLIMLVIYWLEPSKQPADRVVADRV